MHALLSTELHIRAPPIYCDAQSSAACVCVSRVRVHVCRDCSVLDAAFVCVSHWQCMCIACGGGYRGGEQLLASSFITLPEPRHYVAHAHAWRDTTRLHQSARSQHHLSVLLLDGRRSLTFGLSCTTISFLCISFFRQPAHRVHRRQPEPGQHPKLGHGHPRHPAAQRRLVLRLARRRCLTAVGRRAGKTVTIPIPITQH